ncbi:serine hydrolase domain-containing protein [Yoonia sp. 2307UL14-13]|uniref:serine hydrolase domain-containing protein n=1 Tax=Yoonia sp. 2307UL14-13 TaxID=3126506 RepID=UPI0030A40DB6
MTWLHRLLALTLSATPVSAEFDPQAWVDQTLAETGAPGVAAGVVVDGQISIAAGGLRSNRDDVPVTRDDLWHIGSITKSMTGTLIARLAEAGMIRWDDTVGAVLGEVIEDLHPGYADLTYADLLTHRSGIRPNITIRQTRAMLGSITSRDMMVDRIAYAQLVLTKAPGERGKFTYSNAAYVVAGAMLQQSTGQTWEALMQDHVFDPLGLTSAGFGAPGTTDAIDQPRGHSLFLRRPMTPGPTADNVPALGPAGTVHISVADMLTYLRAHALRDPRFLTEDSWARLHSAGQDADYAMGWVAASPDWRGHDGSNTMWYATAAFVPGGDKAVFMAANFAGLSRVAAAMQRGAQALLED